MIQYDLFVQREDRFLAKSKILAENGKLYKNPIIWIGR